MASQALVGVLAVAVIGTGGIIIGSGCAGLCMFIMDANEPSEIYLEGTNNDGGTKPADKKTNAGDPIVLNDNRFKMQVLPLEWSLYLDDGWGLKEHDFHDKLFFYDYNCDGINEEGDRNPTGTLTLFVDFNRDTAWNDGCELLWSLYTPPHEILKDHDSNGDGKIDHNDKIWDRVMLTDYRDSWYPSELGFTSFDLDGYTTYENDCFGVGVYANGYDGYVHDYAYDECIESGWEPIEPLMEDRIRIQSYNPCGVTHEEYGCMETFGYVLGYLV